MCVAQEAKNVFALRILRAASTPYWLIPFAAVPKGIERRAPSVLIQFSALQPLRVVIRVTVAFSVVANDRDDCALFSLSMHLFKQAKSSDEVRSCGRARFIAGQSAGKSHGRDGGVVWDFEHGCYSSSEQAERFAKNDGTARADSLYPGTLRRGNGVVAGAVPLKERRIFGIYDRKLGRAVTPSIVRPFTKIPGNARSGSA